MDWFLSMKLLREFSSVALLSPYDGGNFGDAAIQDALIANFVKYDPNVQLCGITLNPSRTSARHNIPCYPLAVISRPYYEPVTYETQISASQNITADEKSNLSFYARLKQIVRRLPGFEQIRLLIQEVRHIRQSYHLLREINVLAIAGGGQLDEEWGGPWGHPYALAKWAFLARLAGCPVAFLSVGACQMESRLAKFFFRRALSLAAYRSYRDEGSKQLALMLTRRADGNVVPDIAFSLPIAKYQTLKYESSTQLHVALSPIAYAHPGLWPTEGKARYETYISQLAAFASWLLKNEIRVTLFSSSSPDEQIFPELIAKLDADLSIEERRLLSSKEITNHEHLLTFLNSVDFVISSRLHALLLSFLLNKPAIAISYDRKVTCLMDDMRQTNYCFDINAFQSKELIKAFSNIQSDRQNIKSNLFEACRGYDSALQMQYRLVADLFLDRSTQEDRPVEATTVPK